MSAWQMHLEPDLETAVQIGSLNNSEAWLIQDQRLLQADNFPILRLPREWEPMIERWKLGEWEPSSDLPRQ